MGQIKKNTNVFRYKLTSFCKFITFGAIFKEQKTYLDGPGHNYL